MNQPAYQLVPISAPIPERRQPRTPVHLLALVELAEGERVEAVIVNLGLGGAFILCSPPPSYGTLVHVYVHLDQRDEQALRLPGIVRWNNTSGFGVQFQQLGARSTHTISELVNTR